MAQPHVSMSDKHRERAPMFEGTAARFVGQKVLRKEDPRLVTGHGQYVDDVVLPGMVHATFLRSNVAKGRITKLDTSAALGLDGVIAVYTHEDLHFPANAIVPTMMMAMGGPVCPENLLAKDDVRFVGDCIAVVVAESRYIAEDALELIDLEIVAETPVVDIEDALTDTHIVHKELGTNIIGTVDIPRDPHIEGLLTESAHVITATFNQARQTNAPMETKGIVASWDRFRGELVVHMSNQNPHEIRRRAADLLAIDESKVHVSQQDVGGGFGQKMFMPREEAVIVLLAREVGRPLKWIEDRRENLMASNHARRDRGTVTFALDADANIVAGYVDINEDAGAYPFGGAGTGAMAGMLLQGPYKLQRTAFKSYAVFTNTCGRAAYRGPWQFESVIREQMVEHVARRIGMDPVELRRRNVIQWEDLPWTTPLQAMVYDNMSPAETLDQAVEMIGYEAFRAEQKRAFEEEGRLLGIGFSLYIEPSAQNMGPLATEGATVQISGTGKVDVFMGTGSHGQSIETTMAQIVAEELGVHVDDVEVHQGDSNTPFGGGTGGSRTASIVSGAGRAAAIQVRQKVFQIAAHLLEANPDDLEIDSSVVSVKGTPAGKTVTLAQVAHTALYATEGLPPGMETGLEATARHRQEAVTWSNACHVCTVEVNANTGAVSFARYIVSEDCGLMINPMVVEGQVAGGVVQGIAGVLYEDFRYDADGNPLTTTFMDYLLPTAAEVPIIEHGHIETPSNTPGGYKGMGEGGAIGAPPCVFNAVADALWLRGIEVFDHPLGPNEILNALATAH